MFGRSASVASESLPSLRKWRRGSAILFLIACGAGAAGLWGMDRSWGFLTFAGGLWLALIAVIRFAFLSWEIRRRV